MSDVLCRTAPCQFEVDRDELFKQFQPLVYRLIRQYGDNPENREELRGEIYLQFNRIVDVYDPDRGVPLKPYIVRQLTASIYTHARSGWVRRNREKSFDDCPEPTTSENPSNNWDEDILAKAICGYLPDLIAQLPKRQRSVVVMRYFDELSYDQIATKLKVKPATARSLLRHGIENLRKHAQTQY